MKVKTDRHTCHAMGCEVEVPRPMFMCRKHWFMLPKETREAVWDAYVPGQETRMDPSDQYMLVSASAIRWLAEKEGRV